MRILKLFAYLSMSISVCVWLTACPPQSVTGIAYTETPEEAQDILSQDVDRILNSKNTPEQKAETFVLMGEEVLQDDKGFAMAQAVFDEAVKLDKNNKDAEFYRIVLDVLMAFKGMGGDLKKMEIQDLSEDIDEGLKDLDQNEKYVREFFDSGNVPTKLKKDERVEIGSPSNSNIKGISGFQVHLKGNVLAKLIGAMNRLGAFYDEYPDFRKKVVLPIFQREYQKDLKKIGIQKPHRKISVEFDRAMYFALKSSILAASSLIKIFISYNLDDLAKIEKEVKDIPVEEELFVLKKHEDFLTLRRENYLSLDSEKSVMNDLSRLFGTESESGALEELKSELLDPSEKLSVLIAMGKTALQGPVDVELDAEDKINVDFTAFLTNREDKFRDLKIFLPEFKADQEFPLEFPDLTFGGLFPDEDLIQKILLRDYEPPSN